MGWQRAGWWETLSLRVRSCTGCGAPFETLGVDICPACLEALPYTYFWLDARSPLQVTQTYLHDARHIVPLCFYSQEGGLRELVRAMKYHDRYDLARYLGRVYAQRVGWSMGRFDAVVPVPLHWYKEAKRGYNQCMHFARGIAEEWGIPVWSLLRRVRYTASQTRQRSALARSQAVRGVFGLRSGAERYEGYVLLVDDVLTTGSTMLECVKQLRRLPGVSYSIGTLAVARRLCRGGFSVEASGGIFEDSGEKSGDWQWLEEVLATEEDVEEEC